jgi:hypothetical protein
MDELNSVVTKMDLNKNVENVENVENVVKRKKGRPRKDTTNQNVPKNPDEKKKRGRKKKEVVVEEVKQKKKRGRKAAVKYFSSSIRKKIPLTTVLQDNNNYILHLDVKDTNENENDNKNDNEKISDNMHECDEDGNQVDKKMYINDIFDKLQQENDINLNELQKEYDELLENEDIIIGEIIDNEDNLTELYEQRIEYREHQDNQLINKLEKLHKDSNLIDKIFGDDNTKIDQSQEETDILQEQNRKRGYFELLRDFVKNEDWLHKTDVCCWWCCHGFETIPIGMPEKYDELVKKFQVKGVFCSFSCMIAYKNERKTGALKEHLIKYLYNKITGTLLLDAHLEPAPPRCALKMFGGELTIDEFRNSFKENRIYKMIEYPMFVCKDYIEEVDIQNIKRVNKNVFTDNVQQKVANLDNKRIEDARIRLSQIEKTTITLGNTIDKFIKIS